MGSRRFYQGMKYKYISKRPKGQMAMRRIRQKRRLEAANKKIYLSTSDVRQAAVVLLIAYAMYMAISHSA